MRPALALAVALAATAAPAWADEDDEEAADEDEDEDAEPAATADDEDEEEDEDDDGLRPKQNLTGHDLGTNKRANEFERDRFFVDKVDTEKTEKGTLIQGSIASSSFAYVERGGNYAGNMSGTNAGPSRLFTELRLQTDFRHIAASRWEARVDGRARFVSSPGSVANDQTVDPNRIQSGLTGENEYEIRELWLTRIGKRTDFFLGRQFVPDLGAVKFDGLRFDYAKSAKLTVIGFGGLYPLRGSRSLTTDYVDLKTPSGLSPAGKFVTAGGLGGAYRTVNTYGALGLVTLYPLQKEQPRIFVTANGYLRNGATLDVYHFALVDLISSYGFALTNLSLGANLKPNPRLRITANAHRVDTETLGVQAGAFLNAVDNTAGGNAVVQNEAFLQRLAQNQARLGVSAGLGSFQRFEVSTAIGYRHRDEFTLRTSAAMNAQTITLPAAKSVEVWGSVVDRRSIKDTRVGVDASRSFGIGQVAFQRSIMLNARAFALRELPSGRGEWEAEVAYSQIRNQAGGMMCPPTAGLVETQVGNCYGSSNSDLISGGGQLVYRIKRDWLGIANAYLLRTANRRSDGVVDPTVYGFTGFVRIAKRF